MKVKIQQQKRVRFSIFSLIALLVVSTLVEFRFPVFSFLLTVCFFIPIVFFLIYFFGRLWKPMTTLKAILVVALSLLFPVFPFVISQQVERLIVADYIQKKLPPVISALNMYKNETGYYPKTLNSLVPNYLQRIPSFEYMGRTWGVYDSDTSGYEFRLQSPLMKCYKSANLHRQKTENKNLFNRWINCIDYYGF